jgi:serine protease Do
MDAIFSKKTVTRRVHPCRWLSMTLVATVLGTAHADLPDTISKVKLSVVIVGTYRPTDSPRFRLRGTGFVVGDGRQVITNVHVLPDASEDAANAKLVVQVRNAGGDLLMRDVAVVDQDAVHDLALLKLEGAAVPALALKDSNTVREGQSLAFMGFPIGGGLGFSSVTHRATVSSIAPIVLPVPAARQLNERAIRSLRAGPFDIFQLDGTAYPGNSGGPLFDPDTGEVVGIINMVLLKGARESALTSPSGISYAIPGRFAVELLQRNR